MSTKRSATSGASETGVRYCPLCGYVDPGTRDLRCPGAHPKGRRPMFREAHYGYFIRIGLEEKDDAAEVVPVRGGPVRDR